MLLGRAASQCMSSVLGICLGIEIEKVYGAKTSKKKESCKRFMSFVPVESSWCLVSWRFRSPSQSRSKSLAQVSHFWGFHKVSRGGTNSSWKLWNNTCKQDISKNQKTNKQLWHFISQVLHSWTLPTSSQIRSPFWRLQTCHAFHGGGFFRLPCCSLEGAGKRWE